MIASFRHKGLRKYPTGLARTNQKVVSEPVVRRALTKNEKWGEMMIPNEIKKMSTLECLRSMEALWDALCHKEQEIESPLWHKNILGERKEKIKNGLAEFISLEDLKAGAHK